MDSVSKINYHYHYHYHAKSNFVARIYLCLSMVLIGRLMS